MHDNLKFRPELTGETNSPGHGRTVENELRKVLARRAAMELKPGIVINLGVGLPAYRQRRV